MNQSHAEQLEEMKKRLEHIQEQSIKVYETSKPGKKAPHDITMACIARLAEAILLLMEAMEGERGV